MQSAIIRLVSSGSIKHACSHKHGIPFPEILHKKEPLPFPVEKGGLCSAAVSGT